MARRVFLAVAALAGLAHAACADEARTLTPIRIVMHWDHQAQFAGFYMAADKGFYEREGLDVTIVRGGPDIRSCEMVVEGQAQFCASMLSTALEQWAKGVDIVLVSQVVNRSNFEVIAWKRPEGPDGPTILSPSDLEGRRVTVWEQDFLLPYKAFFDRHDVHPKLLPQYYTLSLFVNHSSDACAAMSYNEHHWLLQHGVKPEDITVFPLWQYGVALPEDGIYTTSEYQQEHPEICAAVARATMEGWRYARENVDETLDCVMERVEQAQLPTNRPHMRWMLTHILDSIFPAKDDTWSEGNLTKETFSQVCDLLLKSGWIHVAPEFDDFVKISK